MPAARAGEALDYTDDEETPGWVNEGDEDVDVGDLSQATGALETARDVTFEIKKATLDTQEYKLEDGSKVWGKRNLNLQLNVGPEGLGQDEEGNPKYANKAFFQRLLLS